jgi:hypothetical protein
LESISPGANLACGMIDNNDGRQQVTEVPTWAMSSRPTAPPEGTRRSPRATAASRRAPAPLNPLHSVLLAAGHPLHPLEPSPGRFRRPKSIKPSIRSSVATRPLPTWPRQLGPLPHTPFASSEARRVRAKLRGTSTMRQPMTGTCWIPPSSKLPAREVHSRGVSRTSLPRFPQASPQKYPGFDHTPAPNGKTSVPCDVAPQGLAFASYPWTSFF